MIDPTMDMSEQMAERRGDYLAATSDRLRRQVGTGIARMADYSFRNQETFFRLVATSRHWEENEPLLRPAMRRLLANVAPGESRPDPQPDIADPQEREYIEAALLADWEDWATDRSRVDIAQEHDWASLADVAFGRAVIDGDLFSLLVDDRDCVQLLEAPEIRSPGPKINERGVCGIVKDEYERKVSAWVSPLSTTQEIRIYKQVPFSKGDNAGQNLLQLYFPLYGKQSRGVPALAGVAEKNGMRDDLEFAMLVKQQVAACLTYFEKIDPLAFRSYLEAAQAAADAKKDPGIVDSVQNRFFGSGATSKPKGTVEPHPGMVMRGIPGTEWTAFAPSIPSDGHFQQIKYLLTYLSINLDLPLIVLLLDAEGSSWSSYRHTIDQGRMGFRRLIGQFHSRFAAPTYRWRVGRNPNPRVQAAIAKYGVRAVGKHLWIPKVQPWIDPSKDISAAVAELGHGLTSPSRFAHQRLGMEWRQFYREQINDWGEAIEYAMEVTDRINKKRQGSEQASWRDLFKMPSSDGIRINLGADGGGNDPAPADKQGKP